MLRNCRLELEVPITMLARIVFNQGRWPVIWRMHWIHPLHKRNSKADPNNYRGVHLTSQISKVVERLIKKMIDPYLEKTIGYGENQFTYRTERGARDVLALLMLQ